MLPTTQPPARSGPSDRRSRRFRVSILAIAASLGIAGVFSVVMAEDRVECDGEVATIVGTDGPDLLVGTRMRDVIVGLDGDDVIHGRGGDDLICGGEGDDDLDGGPGDDVLRGDSGLDSLDGGAGNGDTCIDGASSRRCEVLRTSPSTTTTTTTTTTMPPVARFVTLAPGSVLRSGDECAALVRAAGENRHGNAEYNERRGTAPNSEFSRADGDFTGSTDEIIQWTACKWGVGEDMVRAQVALESWWHQDATGDGTDDPSACSPDLRNGSDLCPESIGLMQIRYTDHESAFGDAIRSSAYNLDYSYAWWRSCFEGDFGWLNTIERGGEYAAGDSWGCLGVWHSGHWYTDDAQTYIDRVRSYVDDRIWETAAFGPVGDPTGPPVTTVPPTTAPTTTVAPTTTIPPTTTVAPTTTVPPTTTVAPTTTIPPTTTTPPTTTIPGTDPTLTLRYVDGSSPSASDSNPGTAQQPWRTLTKAGRAARPGERVLIRAGTYFEGLDIEVSGKAGARIVFEAAPGEVVVLRNECVKASGQSHIEIRGLVVRDCTGGDNDAIGIRIEGPGVDDVVIDGNHIINTYGSAISAWGVRWLSDPGDFRNVTNLVITDNLIEQANNGGYNEQITLANGVAGFEIAHNELRNSHNTVRGGEGIDVKEGSSNGSIHHNVIHDIGRRAIYLDGGGRSAYVGAVHDIDVYANVAYNVPNGFAIMSEGGADVYNVRVFNNVFHDIDDDCIFMYDHPNSSGDPTIGHFRNISFVNNTLVDCGLEESWRKGIDINTDKATNVLIRNNIAWPRGIDPGTAETVDHNLTADPRFVDRANRDYRLSVGSPARDSGAPSGAPSHDIMGTPRPTGAGVDIGAYEG